MSQLARLVTATFVFSSAWLGVAGSDAARAPAGVAFTGSALIVASIGFVIVSLHLWTTQTGEDDENKPRNQGNAGGGGPQPHRPDAPPRGGGNGGEPSWWPEFERQLAISVGEFDEREAAAV